MVAVLNGKGLEGSKSLLSYGGCLFFADVEIISLPAYEFQIFTKGFELNFESHVLNIRLKSLLKFLL